MFLRGFPVSVRHIQQGSMIKKRPFSMILSWLQCTEHNGWLGGTGILRKERFGLRLEATLISSNRFCKGFCCYSKDYLRKPFKQPPSKRALRWSQWEK